MGLFLVLVTIGCGVMWEGLLHAFLANPLLNGMIIVVLLLGIGFIFRQVLTLYPEVSWVEAFRAGGRPVPPRLLGGVASLLEQRKGRLSLSAMGQRSILDSISSRLDESRDISRYLIGLLIFLGLLGTFWGLLQTVQAVGGVISDLSIGSADLAAVFDELKSGLEAPLTGMGTAFSSSLFGLAGSLVLGFLDLQASQAQNRFYNELEEWLSGLTRLGGGGPIGDGEQSVPAYLQALIETTADSLEKLQRTIARGEEDRRATSSNIHQLVDKLGTLSDQMGAEQKLLFKLSENQVELRQILGRIADSEMGAPAPGMDEATRSHIRNIDVYLARLVEETSAGRSQMIEEIRSEIRLLARTIANLAKGDEA